MLRCCTFGSRELSLVLHLDAPNGWLHHGTAFGPPGWAGPMHLEIFVRDIDEWVDRMGLQGLLDGPASQRNYLRQPMLGDY